MIKFFRKIRQNLLSEGKTGKYLKYAIGEIVLVMLGILLALSINNWNQHRIDINKEIKALTDLLEEFKLNKERIEERQNMRIELNDKLNNYLDLVSKGKADYKSLTWYSISY